LYFNIREDEFIRFGIVVEAIETLGYRGVRMEIITSVAKKVVGLEWKVYDDDDLSSGLHPFSVGYVSVQEAEQQRMANRASDMMFWGEAAPSLADSQAVMSANEVHIPITTLQARMTLQRFLVLLYALLGGQHQLVQAYQAFYEQFLAGEPELERAHPTNPVHYYIVPVLLVRWVQLRISYWFQNQSMQNYLVPVPNFMDLYEKIALNEDWSPCFPMRYMRTPTPSPAPYVPPTPSPAGGPAPGGVVQAKGGPDTMLANLQYKEDVFGVFKSLNLKIRDILERTSATPQPLSADGTTRMCLSFHLKGICNVTSFGQNIGVPDEISR
jgi:hypothetical protein